MKWHSFLQIVPSSITTFLSGIDSETSPRSKAYIQAKIQQQSVYTQEGSKDTNMWLVNNLCGISLGYLFHFLPLHRFYKLCSMAGGLHANPSTIKNKINDLKYQL